MRRRDPIVCGKACDSSANTFLILASPALEEEEEEESKEIFADLLKRSIKKKKSKTKLLRSRTGEVFEIDEQSRILL